MKPFGLNDWRLNIVGFRNLDNVGQGGVGHRYLLLDVGMIGSTFGKTLWLEGIIL